jgi:hypothetical protein
VITKRTIIAVGVFGSLAAWLAAAATSGVRPVRVVATPRASIDVSGAALTAEIERLHERLKPNIAPDHGRNLFQFAERRSAAAAALAPVPVNDVAAPAPAAPVEPPFKLIGIAEDNGARTAILSSPAQLLMVHEGDNVLGTYRVAGISADAIELTATADGAVLRLALK